MRHCLVCSSCSRSDSPFSGLSNCFRAALTGRILSLHCNIQTKENPALTLLCHIHIYTHRERERERESVIISISYHVDLIIHGTYHTEGPLVQFLRLLRYWRILSTYCDMDRHIRSFLCSFSYLSLDFILIKKGFEN